MTRIATLVLLGTMGCSQPAPLEAQTQAGVVGSFPGFKDACGVRWPMYGFAADWDRTTSMWGTHSGVILPYDVPNSPGEVEIIGVEKNFQTGEKTIIFDIFGTPADVIDLYIMDGTWSGGDPSLGGNGSGTQAAAPLPKTKPEQPDHACFSTVVFNDADVAFDRILNPPPPPLQAPWKKKFWQ